MSTRPFNVFKNVSRFDEAADIIENEFSSLTLDQQYRNAFARLLKQDPLDRVQMLGTDQRDLFTPVLGNLISESMTEPGHLIDFGGGDGQTFHLVADNVPSQSRVSIVEPNEKYLDQYRTYLENHSQLQLGSSLASGLEGIFNSSGEVKVNVFDKACVGLAIHMIYFLSDLEGSLKTMYRCLRKGGVLFIVFAEEQEAYTGHMARLFYERAGRKKDRDTLEEKVAQRMELFGEGGRAKKLLQQVCPDDEVHMESYVQKSRLYGHSLADMIAFCNIAELAGVEGLEKFGVAREALQEKSSLVDLRIEESSDARHGMLSVAQPQRVVVIRKI